MNRGTIRIYNVVTTLALLATVAVILGVGFAMATIPAQPRTLRDPLPPVAQLPTLTPSFTPTPITPTLTPTLSATPEPSRTPTPSLTPTPTLSPTATITDTPAPTFTPSITFTPSASPTNTATLTPTGPTPTPTITQSPFLFDLREQPNFVPNFANSNQCAWQGIGGQVLDLGGTPFSPVTRRLQIHVFNVNGTVDRRVLIGSNTLYGAVSGWEVPVDTRINNELYFVVLESELGTELSPRVQIQFPADCQRNAAIVNFIQQRAFP